MTDPASPNATEPEELPADATEVISPEAAVDPAAEIAKYRDQSLRSQAELDNFRKRAARDREDSVRYANTGLLDRLLPILDNFELGLDAASKSTDASGILQGMSMVRKQLQDFLTESGVETVDAEGQVFDPNVHDALGEEATAEVAEGTVFRQLRKGYKLRDRLLRPATVIVAKAPGADVAANADAS